MIIEIFRDKSKFFRFRIKARNGRILAQSEGYKRKLAVLKTIAVILDDDIPVKDLTK